MRIPGAQIARVTTRPSRFAARKTRTLYYEVRFPRPDPIPELAYRIQRKGSGGEWLVQEQTDSPAVWSNVHTARSLMSATIYVDQLASESIGARYHGVQ